MVTDRGRGKQDITLMWNFIQKSYFELRKTTCNKYTLKYNVKYLSQKVKFSKVNFNQGYQAMLLAFTNVVI